jgi:UDP-2,3-diacylglucosamine pyrophosphatase LpxH
VIAGDFVDFLALEPRAAWTPDQRAAAEKLQRTMNDGPCRPVFDALERVVARGHKIAILAGNHDPEMILPAVQDAFFARVRGGPHQVHFVNDGRAYKLGRAIIEHGDRYDEANWIDWDGLRSIASAASRWEPAAAELAVSAGSVIVERVVNPIKFGGPDARRGYAFIDLLQPQGEVLAFLLLSFEPALKWQWSSLSRVLRGRRRQSANPEGLQPSERRHVAATQAPARDEELARMFPAEYQQLESTRRDIAMTDLPWFTPQKDGLSAVFERGEQLTPDRLEQVRCVLSKLLVDDDSMKLDGDAQQYGQAASRYVRDSGGEIETVLMGHTHLPRHLGPPDRAWYINTGSWADVIRIPSAALQPGNGPELEQVLRELWKDEIRSFVPTHASLRIDADGRVSEARLQQTVIQ